ncbi:MAG: hypothetical protein RLO80_13290 [Hyphomonas sp.]
MMKPIRTLGAAVVALAAPALLTLPAQADTRGALAQVETRIGDNTTLTLSLGGSTYDASYRSRGSDYRRGLNQWGQTDREVRDLTRDALQACRQAVRTEGRRMGYRDIDFDDDQRVRQTGRYGFYVTFDEVEFEGRKRDRESRVTCDVRRGYVESVSGIPRPHPGKGYKRGW